MYSHVIKKPSKPVVVRGLTGDGFKKFYRMHERQGCRVQWGHWYRVMKRRSDPQTLVLKCKPCGEELHRDHPTTRS